MMAVSVKRAYNQRRCTTVLKQRKEIVMTLKQLYFRFFLISCLVLPMQVAEKIGRYILNRINPNYEKWKLLWQITFVTLAGKLLVRGTKYHKELTVELNKRAHSSKAFAYKTLCFIFGLVIIILTLKGH